MTMDLKKQKYNRCQNLKILGLIWRSIDGQIIEPMDTNGKGKSQCIGLSVQNNKGWSTCFYFIP